MIGWQVEICYEKNIIGLCKTNETKNFQTRQVLPARPPPNKFEGATPYSISNAKLISPNGCVCYTSFFPRLWTHNKGETIGAVY